MNNKYKEFKETQEKILNDFSKTNIFFAFSNEQLEEGLKKLNTTIDKIISIGYGGFILKSAYDDYIKLNKKLDDELNQFLIDNDNLYNSFIYELNNHEYCITWDVTDSLRALGLSFDNLNEKQKETLNKATKTFNSLI